MDRRSGHGLAQRATLPAPPRRHTEHDRGLIDRLHANGEDTAPAVLLQQFDHAHLGAALLIAREAVGPRRGGPGLYRIGDHGVVVVTPAEPVRTARRYPAVRALRADTRMLVYLSPSATGPVLRHAEPGGKHVFAGQPGSLTERSRLGELGLWFDAAVHRRHKAHGEPTPAEQEDIATLVRAGLHETLALGITRLGLADQVLKLADSERDIGYNQAADLYLTHVRQTAVVLGVHPADLALPSPAAGAVLRLLKDGRIRPESAVLLIEQVVRDPATPPAELAGRNGLLTDESTDWLDRAVHDGLAALGCTVDGARRMGAKGRRRTRDRLLGLLRAQHPAANLSIIAAVVDRTLSPGEQPRDPGPNSGKTSR